MVAKVMNFINTDIWRLRAKTLPKTKAFFIRSLRVVLLTIKEFGRDQCYLRASALTFYSLLSIVPVFAMIFGIAKGFGLEKMLRERLMQVQGQEEVIARVIEFSEKMLQNTKGGIVAGIGVALLFWTVIKVLNNIEQAFNHIFGVKKQRSMGRKLGDYLSLMLICPLFLIMSGSATVFITKQVMLVTEKTGVVGDALGPLVIVSLSILPYLLFWGLLTFVYSFIPNTKVKLGSAFLAGIVAGTTVQIWQMIYIKFQVGAASAGAVYGSFAALPLFLIWLQISWLIILFGAELAFAHENEETYEFESDCLNVSRDFKNRAALRTVQLCIDNFIREGRATSLADLSKALELPIRLEREVVRDLVRANVLNEVSIEEKVDHFQPARQPDDLTVAFVLNALDAAGAEDLPYNHTTETEEIKKSVSSIKMHVQNSPNNLLLKDISNVSESQEVLSEK